MSDVSKLALSLAACQRCGLREGARAPVFGSGAGGSVMVIGEAPGAKEDQLGEPFVGPSGQLLSQLMAEAGLSRRAFFITNAVKCRPPDNRTPSSSELAHCLPWLYAQIDALSPQGLITVGNLSTGALLGTKGGITKLRGRFFDVNLAGRSLWLRPLLHPAYLLRNRRRAVGSPIDLTLDDLRAVAARLDEDKGITGKETL